MRTFCKWTVLSGFLFILFIKFYLRPWGDLEGNARLLCGLAPNFIASFTVPFGAYWLFTHAQFFNGCLMRFPVFSDVRLVLLSGLVLIVINEYFQLLPVFGRTFDYLDLAASVAALPFSWYSFTGLQRIMSYDRQ